MQRVCGAAAAALSSGSRRRALKQRDECAEDGNKSMEVGSAKAKSG